MKLIYIAIILITCLSMSSCATIFTGTKQRVSINSTPPDAKVQIDGIDRGRTPIVLKLKKGLEGQTISLQSDGYETKIIQPEMTFNGVAVLNFFNLLFWGIDFATGAVSKYSPSFYNIELEPKKNEKK